MPFDEQRVSVFELWRSLAFELIRKGKLRLEKYIPDIDRLCQKPGL